MGNNIKVQSLNMAMQAGKIKSLFPGSSLTYNQNSLTWKCWLQPSPLSAKYEIKLSYVTGDHPNVYVVSPKLTPYQGATKLKHVYDTTKQWLCLYYRKGREWNSGLLIASTVIPWTCEWLLHHECWVATGTWHGGGIEHNTELEKQSAKDKEKSK